MRRMRETARWVIESYKERGFRAFVTAALVYSLQKCRVLPQNKALSLPPEVVPSLTEGGLKLHIGCGSKNLPGYINIDRYPTPGADIIVSADKLFFPDSSSDEIYTSHMIEHLLPSEFDRAIKEWYRVLKPGGKLKIRCPNFELYVKEWLEGDYEYRWGWGIINIFGHDNRDQGVLTRNGFTPDRLDRLLSAAGFKTIECKVTSTRPEYDNTVEYRPDGDIYYEGVKEDRVIPERDRRI